MYIRLVCCVNYYVWKIYMYFVGCVYNTQCFAKIIFFFIYFFCYICCHLMWVQQRGVIYTIEIEKMITFKQQQERQPQLPPILIIIINHVFLLLAFAYTLKLKFYRFLYLSHITSTICLCTTTQLPLWLFTAMLTKHETF